MNPIAIPFATSFAAPSRLAVRGTLGGVVAAATLAAALAGCVPLVVGGATAAGIGIMATDRRSSGAQLDDQGIELRTAGRISEIADDNMNISTVSYNRQVLMTGTVASEADRQRAEQAVREVRNVRSVVNEVVVGPALGIARRSNDALVTTKVKASLLDAKDISGNAFKVVTEGGVVYLMGLATPREVERATDIARGVSGVSKVVRAVEMVSENQLGAGAAEGPTGINATSVPGVGPTGASPAPSSSNVPLPPMEPLPAPGSAAPMPQPGVVTTPVR